MSHWTVRRTPAAGLCLFSDGMPMLTVEPATNDDFVNAAEVCAAINSANDVMSARTVASLLDDLKRLAGERRHTAIETAAAKLVDGMFQPGALRASFPKTKPSKP